MRKSVLITGSSGFIGQHLSKYLKDDYDVYGLDVVEKPDDQELKGFLLENITANRRPWDFKYNKLSNFYNCVVHLAANVRVNESMTYPSEYIKTNINGLYNTFTFIDTGCFIFASTAAAENPKSVYDLTKRLGEDMVNEYACNKGIPYTLFRFSNVIGSDGIMPTNTDGLMYNLIDATKTGTFNLYGNDYNTFDGSAIRDYIHVNEVCESIRKAIEEPSSEIENIGTGIGYTVKQIINIFKKVNDVNFDVVEKDRRPADSEKLVMNNISKYYKSEYTIDEMLKIKGNKL